MAQWLYIYIYIYRYIEGGFYFYFLFIFLFFKPPFQARQRWPPIRNKGMALKPPSPFFFFFSKYIFLIIDILKYKHLMFGQEFNWSKEEKERNIGSAILNAHNFLYFVKLFNKNIFS